MQNHTNQLQPQHATERHAYARHESADVTQGIAWQPADPAALEALLETGLRGQALMNHIFSLIPTTPRLAFGLFRALEAYDGQRYNKEYGALSAALRRQYEPQKTKIRDLLNANEYRQALQAYDSLEAGTGLKWTGLWEEVVLAVNTWARSETQRAFDLAQQGDPECARVYAHLQGQTGRQDPPEEKALRLRYEEGVRINQLIAELPREEA